MTAAGEPDPLLVLEALDPLLASDALDPLLASDALDPLLVSAALGAAPDDRVWRCAVAVLEPEEPPASSPELESELVLEPEAAAGLTAALVLWWSALALAAASAMIAPAPSSEPAATVTLTRRRRRRAVFRCA